PKAIPRDTWLDGNDSEAVRSAPGNAAPSPNPNTALASANPIKPVTHACDVLAAVHKPTAINMPRRRPTESSTEPHRGFPIMYAYEKAEIAFVYAFALRPVSRSIVGARTASTCRSIYDRSVPSMIVVGATQFLIVVGAGGISCCSVHIP